MTNPQRPSWKRKRWVAAGLFWLVVAYPLSLPPFAYAVARGWIPTPLITAYATPYEVGPEAIAHLTEWCCEQAADSLNRYNDFIGWCYATGEQHAADAKSE